MSLPKCILVPTDFSHSAELALDYAVALASKLDGKVHLLNVIGLGAMGADFNVVVTADMVQAIRDGSQKELERLIAARAAEVAFGAPLQELGDARAAIAQTAETLHADLIVMGTHGRRGFKRLLLGSVAESIVRTAHCPVLLVRDQGN